MKLTLITLSGIKVDESIYAATLPTVDGQISVFPGHEPLVTVLDPGVISVRWAKDDAPGMEYYAVSGGVAKVDQTGVRILVDEADHGEDIIEAETQAALQRALKARDESGDQVEREKAKQLIDRHLVRLKVADLQRRKRRN